MIIGIVSKVFHVSLSPLFIFGWLFIPGMGVVGRSAGECMLPSCRAYLQPVCSFYGRTQLQTAP
jgi:uncharacterized membrane protein